MASSPELVAYIAEQLGGEAQGIHYKKMFGEYGFYRGAKFYALVCDDAFYFKPTQAARTLLQERNALREAPPYTGASLYFLIENVDDGEFLRQLSDATFEELPLPKPKKPKEDGEPKAKPKKN